MKGEQEAGEEATVWDSTLSQAVTSSKEEGGDGARGQSGLGHLKEGKTVCKPGGCTPVIQT